MNPFRRLTRNCWRKQPFAWPERAKVAGRKYEQRRGEKLYYYKCQFGDHYHLTRDRRFLGRPTIPVSDFRPRFRQALQRSGT